MNSIIRRMRHFFIPSEHNNFRAKGLHLDVLTFLVLIAITINTIEYIWPGQLLGYATDITIEKLFSRTNEERTKQGLPPLKYNNALAEAAANKAQDMFTYNYWAHYRPGDGTPPWYFITQAGYQYEFAGENLANGFMFSDAVVDGWMNSATHRANILRQEYDEVGFAIMNGVLQNQETTLVVQMFGKPILAQKPFAPKAAVAAEKDLNKILEQKPIATPTYTPQPTSMQISALNQSKPPQLHKASLINFDRLSFNSSFIIIVLLLIILTLDLLFAIRLKIIRVNGKNFAHWLFLGSIAIALLIIRAGLIL